ncbi:phosphocholine cytidylyltransferase family protein [Pontixanthobacter aquaemixtae]|uniref:NTP transferase domain-containing protein n=1 Tax=Pontixanthobacter aquaemixtae TaxID=1958940 RepID=A0A844ZSL0_9SPHN|nr:NTP transferase domain-containing protein [Pontixanthobacter aquaemixtae]MXO90863.1 NTP transferase domain-containing protein [Pontixanthobacter aquaemixtae]
MEALILAAGLGSRIRDVAPCKPLTELDGLSLLEISVRQLASVGATRIVVSVGYQAEEIETALPAISARAAIPVEPRRVDDFHQPNGRSVITGSEEFDGDFLLVMADHIFSRDVLAALVSGPDAKDGAVLAIDRHTNSPLVDPEDATWVMTSDDGKIRHIGKSLTEYSAVDCGAFRVSPALPAAIRAAIRDGKPGSLSDGMQYLADAGRASTVDIGDAWWIDVDDASALALAREQIGEHLPELFGTLESA